MASPRADVKVDPLDCSEAAWVAAMTGFRLTCDGLPSVEPSPTHEVFYASVTAVSAEKNLETVQPWVCVDGRVGMFYPVGAEGVFQAPLRTLWFNVAMLGLLLRDGLLVHVAGASLKAHGLLFLGVSGIGKSTLSQLLEDAFPGSVLGDERIGVRPEAGIGGMRWKMSGSPWTSSAGIARQREAPLSALVFLEQASENAIHSLSAAEALPRMLPLISVDWKLDALADRGVAALNALLSAVPAYVFRFSKSPAAADFISAWAETLAC